MDSDKTWHVKTSQGKAQGPFAERYIVKLLKSGVIKSHHQLMHSERTQGEWVTASSIPSVARLLNQKPIDEQQIEPATTEPTDPSPDLDWLSSSLPEPVTYVQQPSWTVSPPPEPEESPNAPDERMSTVQNFFISMTQSPAKALKVAGGSVALLGLLLALSGWMSDASVTSANGIRVMNLQKMQRQSMTVNFGFVMIISGIALLVTGVLKTPNPSVVSDFMGSAARQERQSPTELLHPSYPGSSKDLPTSGSITSPKGPPDLPSNLIWYVSTNGQKSPPLRWGDLQNYSASGRLSATTLVWRDGFSNWIPAGKVQELASLTQASPRPRLSAASLAVVGNASGEYCLSLLKATSDFITTFIEDCKENGVKGAIEHASQTLRNPENKHVLLFVSFLLFLVLSVLLFFLAAASYLIQGGELQYVLRDTVGQLLGFDSSKQVEMHKGAQESIERSYRLRDSLRQWGEEMRRNNP